METSRIVFHCSNGLKESCSLGMLHSFIRLFFVQVDQLDILWEPIPRICTNDSKTRITIPIKTSVCKKIVFYRSHWLFMKQLPLAAHTSTDHFQQITLNYV